MNFKLRPGGDAKWTKEEGAKFAPYRFHKLNLKLKKREGEIVVATAQEYFARKTDQSGLQSAANAEKKWRAENDDECNIAGDNLPPFVLSVAGVHNDNSNIPMRKSSRHGYCSIIECRIIR